MDQIIEPLRSLEFIDVWIADIKDSKEASKILKCLPFIPQYLSHAKRIKRSLDQDKTLSVILDVVGITDIEDFVNSLLLKDKLNNIRIYKIPKYPPVTRTQLHEWKSFWPLAFHSSEIEKTLSDPFVSDKNEISRVQKLMDVAIEKSKVAFAKGCIPIGAIIVDPLNDDKVLASFHDTRPETCVNSMCTVMKTPNNEMVDSKRQESNSHPLQHATITCINFIASEEKISRGKNQGESEKRKLMATSELPYLCTSYDMYVTHEPCVFCSMALLHSRISRVFYLYSNAKSGGLGGKYSLHLGQNQRLNHKFKVYKIHRYF
jgi:tRNA-specific adenosine deaminase 3